MNAGHNWVEERPQDVTSCFLQRRALAKNVPLLPGAKKQI
jgi:hypothetical protein